MNKWWRFIILFVCICIIGAVIYFYIHDRKVNCKHKIKDERLNKILTYKYPRVNIIKKQYYIIILIIISFDGENKDLYKEFFRIMKLYEYKNQNCKFIYIQNIEDDNQEFVYFDNKSSILTLNLSESVIPGVIYKCLAGMQFANNNYRYKYLVRSNLSSCLNTFELVKVLNADNNDHKLIYGGRNMKTFMSGPVTISYKLQNYILENITDEFLYVDNDDVIIGTILKGNKNVQYVNYKDIDFSYHTNITDSFLLKKLNNINNKVWLRVKNKQQYRSLVDIFIHKEFVKRIYNIDIE